jgi:hypothetical protein
VAGNKEAILRRHFGALGRYKLNWILVKPFITQPRGAGMSHEFTPHFPMTMRDLNKCGAGRRFRSRAGPRRR